jgi:L-lactate dehydrogenase complex protein LldF
MIPKHDFKKAVRAAINNPYLQQAMETCTVRRTDRVINSLAELKDLKQTRQTAQKIKQYTIDHLDEQLALLSDKLESLGVTVHWAKDARQAREIIIDIAHQHDCRHCVKTKSMTTEEIELTPALNEAGIETIETDLGEYILQLDNDRPSHIITPMIHKSRQEVGQLFQDKLHADYTEEPEELTAIARHHLREKFQQADLGIVGVNFAVAQTGSLVVVENEGNGRMVTARPGVLVGVMGMEKVVPSAKDLAVMLKLYIRSAVGLRLTSYTNIITGPRKSGEIDGPEHLHLVILDNNRSEILAGPYRNLLHCLRCGACLNACPVYRKISGHAYGTVYPGPIGAAITPLLESSNRLSEKLPEFCSLCGACLERCPVMIDLPGLLIQHKRDLIKKNRSSLFYKLVLSVWTWFYSSPARYRFSQKWARHLMRLIARNGWVTFLPPPGSHWTAVRDVPLPKKQLFRDLWKKTNGNP